MYKYNNHIISHFPGGVGNYGPKYDNMSKYLLYLFDYYRYGKLYIFL